MMIGVDKRGTGGSLLNHVMNLPLHKLQKSAKESKKTWLCCECDTPITNEQTKPHEIGTVVVHVTLCTTNRFVTRGN
jgi:hypothetical protein